MGLAVSACGSDPMPVAFIELAETCAPSFAAETLAAVVSVESGMAPLAIRVNSNFPLKSQPRTKAEAIETATVLIAEGQSIDLGLGGISATSLGRLGLTVSDAFEPCQNLKATAKLLEEYKVAATKTGLTASGAEAVMLQSYYGQGDPSLGKMVGYDRRVRQVQERLQSRLATLTLGDAPQQILPPRESGGGDIEAAPSLMPSAANAETSGQELQQSAGSATAAAWDVFKSAETSSVLVFSRQTQEQ
jgi:type IV secretion system protein VirB1